MPDSIVILRCQPDLRATKLHRWNGSEWQTESYNAGKYFQAHTRRIDGVTQLGRLIHRASHDKRAMAIRGALKGTPEQGKIVRRQYLPEDSDIVDVDRCWITIDLDSAPAPRWIDHQKPKTLRDTVRWAVLTYLPNCFFGIGCYFRWSASAGVKPWDELRLQLWYWVDRPACNKSLREWLQNIPHVDVSLFNPVQPHFIACPVFIDGSDPIREHRDGMLRGPPHVVLPNCVVDLEAHQRRTQERAANPKPPVRGDYHTAFVRGCVRKAVQNIRDASDGYRHMTVFASAAWLGKLVAGGLLDETTATAELRRAMEAKLPAARHKKELLTIRDGLERGKKTPFDFSA
jgi:hypothetical protein